MARRTRKKRRAASTVQSDTPIRIMPWWWSLIATTISIASGVAAWFVVWSIAKHDATLRIEAIKVGLSVTAGAGAACGLLLSFRRQIHSEYVAQDLAFDATQRRVTELYAKAVEQLGNEKAAVRLGGLYALERLGQENAGHRQTVIDVICAYLRMPYELPSGDNTRTKRRSATPDSTLSGSAQRRDLAQQELLVRMAAQEVISRHLVSPEITRDLLICWDGLTINLQGAHLVDAAFSRCRFYRADFSDVVFTGTTWFDQTSVLQFGLFNRTRFEGDVTFNGQFHVVQFDAAEFKGEARFEWCQFDDDAIFDHARFDKEANFREVKFNGLAFFEDSHFQDVALFADASFGYVSFENARFTSIPDFTDATARVRNVRNSIWPDSWVAKPDEESGRLKLVRA